MNRRAQQSAVFSMRKARDVPEAWMPVTASVVPERLASDHRPVVAEFDLTTISATEDAAA